MSRLDSAIRRLEAQRHCLNRAARMIDGVSGPVLEFGLGNGRTFDHLRELFPDREIFVFDRHVEAHRECIPDDRHIVVGDFRDTLAGAGARIGAPAALVHCDVGSGRAEEDRRLARYLAGALSGLVAPGCVVVADQALDSDTLVAIDPPSEVEPRRYFMYRAVPT
ncbi:MAG: hypothetical protein GY791_00120 [Alphaproteobacteria bacterium]|nr:hypothetical protein [Alphaproteobacteria bacterium]